MLLQAWNKLAPDPASLLNLATSEQSEQRSLAQAGLGQPPSKSRGWQMEMQDEARHRGGCYASQVSGSPDMHCSQSTSVICREILRQHDMILSRNRMDNVRVLVIEAP